MNADNDWYELLPLLKDGKADVVMNVIKNISNPSQQLRLLYRLAEHIVFVLSSVSSPVALSCSCTTRVHAYLLAVLLAKNADQKRVIEQAHALADRLTRDMNQDSFSASDLDYYRTLANIILAVLNDSPCTDRLAQDQAISVDGSKISIGRWLLREDPLPLLLRRQKTTERLLTALDARARDESMLAFRETIMDSKAHYERQKDDIAQAIEVLRSATENV